MKEYRLQKKNYAKMFFVFWAVFLVGMFFASANTSPLYPKYFAGDSAIFNLIGKGMAEGKTVYKDLFDHKGPILFFIQKWGYLMGGRGGVFFIQCILGSFNLLFLYKLWMIIKNQEKNTLNLIFVFICGYAMFFYTFQKGNLSEEYSLPVISISLYLFAKYALSLEKTHKHPCSYSIVYGISVAVISFIRINNAVSVLAGIAVIAIYLIVKKQFANLFLNLLCGMLGALIVALPVIMYFATKDALYEMIYATFTFNFLYAKNIGHSQALTNLTTYLPLYLPLILSIIMICKKILKEGCELFDVMTAAIVGANFVCLIVGNKYAHYFAIFMPVFVLVLTRYASFDIRSLMTKFVVLATALNLGLAGYSFAASFAGNYITKSVIAKSEAIKEITKIIPEQEKNSVIGYNIRADVYMMADIMPCHKYWTFQDWWSQNDPSIKTEFMSYIKEEEPLWVLTNPLQLDIYNDEVLQGKYNLLAENEYVEVYRLK